MSEEIMEYRRRAATQEFSKRGGLVMNFHAFGAWTGAPKSGSALHLATCCSLLFLLFRRFCGSWCFVFLRPRARKNPYNLQPLTEPIYARTCSYFSSWSPIAGIKQSLTSIMKLPRFPIDLNCSQCPCSLTNCSLQSLALPPFFGMAWAELSCESWMRSWTKSSISSSQTPQKPKSHTIRLTHSERRNAETNAEGRDHRSQRF